MDHSRVHHFRTAGLFLGIFLFIFTACGDSGGRNAASSAGTLAFGLDFEDGAPMVRMSSDVDICAAYGIEQVNAAVMYSDETVIRSGSWPCSAHTGQLSDVPADSGLVLVVEALVSGRILYRGYKYDIQVLPAQHTDAGTIGMEYIGVQNQPPRADAGPDQTVDEGAMVTLNGDNSDDPDDGIAAYQWRQTQGVEVVLDSAEEPEVNFIAPDVNFAGTALVFELTVTDYSGDTSVDSCIVNVTWVNMAPNADAGKDQKVKEGSQVRLDASRSSDPDDGIASYSWKQTAGPAIALSNPTSPKPTFQAPDVAPAGASLRFEVTVTDAGGLQDTDNCTVHVTHVNTPPVADAGADQEVYVGSIVILDGSRSADMEDAQIASFHWRQTDGSPVTLSDATAEKPEFSAPFIGFADYQLRFELTVTDSGGLTGTDDCQVYVRPGFLPW